MKKIMLNLFIFVGVLTSFNLLVQANEGKKTILLISDIDDTIKVSHVLNNIVKVGRASDVTTPFRGMADLYKQIIADNTNDQTEVKVIYLSNAPDEIAGIPALRVSHQTFLKFNEFPAGELALRENLFEKDHKIKEIRHLIDSLMPSQVILIGDNGEKDAAIYQQAKEEYKDFPIQFHVFIHQLYNTTIPSYIPKRLAEKGSSLLEDQVGFVTPIEVALTLNQKNLLSEVSVQGLAQKLIPQILSESRFKWDGLRPLTFPFFKRCSDFKWNWSRSSDLLPLIQKLETRCSSEFLF